MYTRNIYVHSIPLTPPPDVFMPESSTKSGSPIVSLKWPISIQYEMMVK